jgi:hypothetical protein
MTNGRIVGQRDGQRAGASDVREAGVIGSR